MDTIYSPPGNINYYDDYDPNKNYLQLLFQPARAVQCRELTQIQSVLQNQIAQAGAFWYKSGTPITGGRITVSYSQPYMKVQPNDMDGQPIDVTLLVGRTYVGQTSGQMITVIDCDTDNRYVFFSYLGGLLTDGEMFVSTTTPTRSFSMTSGSVANAIVAHCTAGTLFINGFYATITEDNLVVAVDDQDAVYNIGYSVKERFVTSQTDPSLNDNASGSTNANAPGADRFQIICELISFKGNTAPEGINFISGITIQNRSIIKEQSNPLQDTALIE